MGMDGFDWDTDTHLTETAFDNNDGENYFDNGGDSNDCSNDNGPIMMACAYKYPKIL